jgi:hypothetical protein
MKILGESGAILKACLLIVLCGAMGIFLAISVSQTMAQTEVKVPEAVTSEKDLNDISVENTGYKKDRRGPVMLTHTKHSLDYGVSCWDCHHIYEEYEEEENKKNTWSPLGTTQKCNECHDPVKVQDKAMKLQTAYHMNCKGCHKELAEKNEKTGAFRKCLKCHEKVKMEVPAGSAGGEV